ncbi:MAG: chitobiase/beta-hexosaminidase C-terminal domain-containing protein, partial [Candidatus Cloacimonadaceae bacterium]|nr:chitobiase/beta-hexosaminidase C-terminal domain-containing protein [Candidatus Cloacimonadaceae bacterium]
ILASTQGATALPVFNPPAGVYSSPQNVAISCPTPGAVIYYTTNGSNPTLSSPQYTAPIPVSTTTTIKAIAKAPQLDPSQIVTAVYSFAVPISNLSQLRAQTPGTSMIYQITGQVVLTFKQNFRGQKYVQDNAAGVLIDDPSGVITTTYALYDGITGLTGTIARYNNMLQFTPVGNPGPPTSVGNQVYIPMVTIAQINANIEMYQARLVKIDHVHFVGASGAFANGQNYTLEDASGTIVFRTSFYDVDYIGQNIPTGNFSVVVLANQFNQTPQVTARLLSDWGGVANDDEVLTPASTRLIGNYPNPFNPSTTIEFYTAKAEPVEIVIFNQRGQTVKTFSMQTSAKGNHSVQWNGTDDRGLSVSSGVYYFHLKSGSYSSTKKMVLMK